MTFCSFEPAVFFLILFRHYTGNPAAPLGASESKAEFEPLAQQAGVLPVNHHIALVNCPGRHKGSQKYFA